MLFQLNESEITIKLTEILNVGIFNIKGHLAVDIL